MSSLINLDRRFSYKLQMAKTEQASKRVEKDKKMKKRMRSRSKSRSKSRSNSKERCLKPKPDPSVPIPPPKEIVDTKTFSLRFDDQKQCEAKAKAANFVRCHNCQAILTAQSVMVPQTEYVKLKLQADKSDEVAQKYIDYVGEVWICEFCQAHNPVPDNHHPEANPCYILSDRHSKIELEQTNQILIFCIDVSGSMEMEVVGRKNRLDCVVEAIIDELKKMKIEKSRKRVGVVLFGSEVTVVGDGSGKELKVPNGLFSSYEGLVGNAQTYLPLFSLSITDSYEQLKKTVKDTICHGSTALGPALVTSIELASHGAPGSRVIICTDGEANVGVGSNDNNFYQKTAQYAKNKAVNVSVLTIKGAHCNVKLLAQVSLATGGSVMKVDPQKLGSQFSKIVSDEVLGTDAELVIRLNHRFRFRQAKEAVLSDHGRLLRDKLGNFTLETELAYHFDIITDEQNKDLKIVNPNLFKCTRLPIQIQLSYTGSDSIRYLQLFTDWREVTDNQSQLVAQADFPVLAASLRQLVSIRITQGQFEAAKEQVEKFDKLCEKFGKVEGLQEEVGRQTTEMRKLEKILKSKWRKSLKPGTLCPEYLQQQKGNEKLERERSRSGSRSRSRSRSRQYRCRVRHSDRDRDCSRDRNTKKDKKRKMRRSRSRSMSSQSQDQVIYQWRKTKRRC